MAGVFPMTDLTRERIVEIRDVVESSRLLYPNNIRRADLLALCDLAERGLACSGHGDQHTAECRWFYHCDCPEVVK